FFQAEDGIRDFHVTGVQTCALPIYSNVDLDIIHGLASGDNLAIMKLYKLYFPPIAKMVINNQGSKEEAQDIFQETVMVLYDRVRSEERRVGKEWRSGWWAED